MLRAELVKRDRLAFLYHRSNAKKRGIPFLFSYEQWLSIWIDSGKISLRGTHSGQYVMARHGDVGPYSITNVRITTVEQNHSEGRIGKRASIETRKKLSASRMGKAPPNLGKPHTDQTKAKMRLKALERESRRRKCNGQS